MSETKIQSKQLDIDEAVTVKQDTTPSNPAAGYNKLYFKSDDDLYKLDSGGSESLVGISDHTQLSNIGTLTHSEVESRLEALGSGNIYSLELNGTTQYATITDGDQTGLDLSTDFTIEAWIFWDDFPTGDRPIINKGGTSTSTTAYRFYYKNADKCLSVKFCDSSNNLSDFRTATNSITPDFVGGWHHVAVSVDISVPSATFYIDGVQKATTTDNNAATSIRDSSANMHLGYNGAARFKGKLDDVRIWNDIRTLDEIRDNYYRSLFGDEAGLVANWKLDNNYLDATVNGNDLTGVGTPTFATAHSPTGSHLNLTDIGTNTHAEIDSDLATINTKVPPIRCISLNGTTQYAEITDANQLLLDFGSSSITLEAWIYPTNNTATNKYIVAKDSEATRGYGWYYASGTLYFYYYDNSNPQNLTSYSYAVGDISNRWTHVAVVNNTQAPSAVFYVNGSAVTPTVISSSAQDFKDSNNPFSVGRLYYNAGDIRYFAGLISDLRVWRTARSAANIADNYLKKLFGTETNLTSNWKFDGNYNDSQLTNTNDLTPYPSAAYSLNIPPYIDVRQQAGTQIIQSQYVNATSLQSFTTNTFSDLDSMSVTLSNFTANNILKMTFNANTSHSSVGDRVAVRFTINDTAETGSIRYVNHHESNATAQDSHITAIFTIPSTLSGSVTVKVQACSYDNSSTGYIGERSLQVFEIAA